MTVVVALSFAFSGIVGLVLIFAGPSTYEQIARAEGFERIPFLVPGTAPLERRQSVRYDIRTRVALHEGTLRFVLSQVPGSPRDPTTRDPLFSTDEQQHLADVRVVFTAVRIGALVVLAAALALVWSGTRAGGTVVIRLIRDAAVLATIIVAAIAAVFAFAFEPAFLAFHYVFFPQGNFLFDPATSDLLALYPEAYWYGVTIRIGLTFVGAMLAVAVSATLLLRSRATR
jgi:integral membrane protein (TIGR01906 family)